MRCRNRSPQCPCISLINGLKILKFKAGHSLAGGRRGARPSGFATDDTCQMPRSTVHGDSPGAGSALRRSMTPIADQRPLQEPVAPPFVTLSSAPRGGVNHGSGNSSLAVRCSDPHHSVTGHVFTSLAREPMARRISPLACRTWSTRIWQTKPTPPCRLERYGICGHRRAERRTTCQGLLRA